MVDIDLVSGMVNKPFVKSTINGTSDLEASQVLLGYSLEFDVPLDVVVALYDMMPNELYDGIRTALEDCDIRF